MAEFPAIGYALREPNAPFERIEYDLGAPGPGEAIVRVAGCGVCHTDIGFYTGSVRTAKSPVVLGHEISGTVEATGEGVSGLEGRAVIVPAVLPCGECDLCRGGRANVCQRQVMPGNHVDGGFATRIRVPARFLCPLPDDLGEYRLEELAVIADAVTTPWQSYVRSGLAEGDVAIVIGVGGLGSYMVQIARSAGAQVIAIDVDAKRLENARRLGAVHAIDASGLDEKALKKAVREFVREQGLPSVRWKVFEMSGTAAGQQTAMALLSFAGTVGIVGFTMDKVTVRLSNVMAFDADLFGNWGCRPDLYPDAVAAVLDGRIDVRSNVETHPLDSIDEVFRLALEHKLERRAVLVP